MISFPVRNYCGAMLSNIIRSKDENQGEKFMEVFLIILVVLIFYLILVILISLIRALFSIRKGKKYAKETFLLLTGVITVFFLKRESK